MYVLEEKLKSLLDKKIEEFTTDCLGPLKRSLDEVKSSFRFLCNQYDDLQETGPGLKEENKKLMNENESLKLEIMAIKNDVKI